MKKITYKILICDDNDQFVKRLYDALSVVNSRSDEFMIETHIAMTPTECLTKIQNNVYDIIILDVCIKNNHNTAKTNIDLIRNSISAEYYGPEFYEQILRTNSKTKVFVVSNLPVSDLRVIFNGAQLDYFNKHNSTPKQIAQYIKNFFDTGKERIYNNVFVVYGHNPQMRSSVEDYLKTQGLKSIDLFENSTGGIQSVFDALNNCSDTAECAIILLSADDIVLDKENLQFVYRARQNVIFEMGLFAGHLGKDKAIVLYEKNNKFEFPSDITGIFYIEYDEMSGWKRQLEHNLKKIGFII